MAKSLIVDANVLMLFIIGEVRPERIGEVYGTKGYDHVDLGLLREYISRYQQLTLTPHILAETSNLVRQAMKHQDGEKASAVLAHVASVSVEMHVQAVSAAMRKEYLRLGLTDAAILRLAKDEGNLDLLTADYALHTAAQLDGLATTNFGHLRASRKDLR